METVLPPGDKWVFGEVENRQGRQTDRVLLPCVGHGQVPFGMLAFLGVGWWRQWVVPLPVGLWEVPVGWGACRAWRNALLLFQRRQANRPPFPFHHAPPPPHTHTHSCLPFVYTPHTHTHAVPSPSPPHLPWFFPLHLTLPGLVWDHFGQFGWTGGSERTGCPHTHPHTPTIPPPPAYHPHPHPTLPHHPFPTPPAHPLACHCIPHTHTPFSACVVLAFPHTPFTPVWLVGTLCLPPPPPTPYLPTTHTHTHTGSPVVPTTHTPLPCIFPTDQLDGGYSLLPPRSHTHTLNKDRTGTSGL